MGFATVMDVMLLSASENQITLKCFLGQEEFYFHYRPKTETWDFVEKDTGEPRVIRDGVARSLVEMSGLVATANFRREGKE